MMEMVMAMAFAIIVFSAFFSIMGALNRTNKVYRAEARAILALDNMLERLEAEKSPDVTRVKKILAEELTEGGLGLDHKITHTIDFTEGKYRLTIYRDAGKKRKRKLAEVSLSCPK
jgi:hypothetical protein